MRSCLWLMLLLPLSATAGILSLDDAERYYRDGHLPQALQIFRQLAQSGDADAQFRLGEFYVRGEGMAKDAVKACDWFERAADQGHVQAFHVLADCYLNGEGREQDTDTAVYLYGSAAESGLVRSQYQLARMYATGSGVPKNAERGYIYLLLAVRGDTDAIAANPAMQELHTSLEAELSQRQLQRARDFVLRQLPRFE